MRRTCTRPGEYCCSATRRAKAAGAPGPKPSLQPPASPESTGSPGVRWRASWSGRSRRPPWRTSMRCPSLPGCSRITC
eukprot:scaffold127695_cov43-Prasinocladus_malaysianus.AAC.1